METQSLFIWRPFWQNWIIYTGLIFQFCFLSVKIWRFGAERGQEGHSRDGKGLFKWLQLMRSINLLYALRPLQINFTPAASRLIMWQRAGNVPSPSGWRSPNTQTDRRTDRQLHRQISWKTDKHSKPVPGPIWKDQKWQAVNHSCLNNICSILVYKCIPLFMPVYSEYWENFSPRPRKQYSWHLGGTVLNLALHEDLLCHH